MEDEKQDVWQEGRGRCHGREQRSPGGGHTPWRVGGRERKVKAIRRINRQLKVLRMRAGLSAEEADREEDKTIKEQISRRGRE